jgi:bifunctional non-homologous end joining protein LigD
MTETTKSAGTSLPRVQPVIPAWRKEPFDDPDWLFDMKYDGYRALCDIEQRRNRLISRNNNVMSRFDALAGQVAAALNIDDAILDGKVIAADETGRPVFIDLLRGTPSPCYVAFDLLWLNWCRPAVSAAQRAPAAAADHSAEGLADRLRGAVRRGQGWELFELICTNDLEGIVAKRFADSYDPRVRWLKIKNRDYSQKEGRGDLFNGPRR